MGLNASTRRVTVVNDNQSGVIRISESVVQKISQQQKQQTPETRSSDDVQRQQQTTTHLPQQQTHENSTQLLLGSPLTSREDHEKEIRALEKTWKNQIQELQKQNRQLWRTANEKLSANISDVEKHLIKTKCEPICRQNEKQVVDCYQHNRSQPLKCSQEVKGFVNCVEEVRRSVFNRNG